MIKEKKYKQGNGQKKIKIYWTLATLLLMIGLSYGSFQAAEKPGFTETSQMYRLEYSILYPDDTDALRASSDAKSIPVLLYHGIVREPDGYNVLPDDFKNQMFTLKKAGYQTVTLEDFNKFMEGEKALPDKSFLLTFDDGRKDSYYPTDPILEALDYNAVIFIISKHTDGNSHYLSEKELRQMLNSGRWEIQSHGKFDHDPITIDNEGKKGHFLSSKLWIEAEQRHETDREFRQRITGDLVDSKEDLDNLFAIDVTGYAYPFGDYGQKSLNYPDSEKIIHDAVQSVYDLAFYQYSPEKGDAWNSPSENTLMIKRINVLAGWSGTELLHAVESGAPKELPYTDNFNNTNHWNELWGTSYTRDKTMIIGPSAWGTGGSVYLSGSSSWEDYIYKAKIRTFKGDSISLIARFSDTSNYAACVFSKDSVRIRQRSDGETSQLSEGKIDLPENDFEIGIKVYGSQAECILNNRTIATTSRMDKIPANGGIGIITWTPEINNSKAVVGQISVEAI